MFVSDAHLFVPREIRWNRVLAIRFSALRRRKSLRRRIMRDLRKVLPVLGLALTFAATLATTELVLLLVPSRFDHQGAMTQLVQTTLAMLQ